MLRPSLRASHLIHISTLLSGSHATTLPATDASPRHTIFRSVLSREMEMSRAFRHAIHRSSSNQTVKAFLPACTPRLRPPSGPSGLIVPDIGRDFERLSCTKRWHDAFVLTTNMGIVVIAGSREQLPFEASFSDQLLQRMLFCWLSAILESQASSGRTLLSQKVSDISSEEDVKL